MSSTKTTTTKSPWWYCADCGYKNKPRHYGDKAKCEQCGSEREKPDHIDYRPDGAA